MTTATTHRRRIAEDAPRPRLKSFDVFDTLIARRCVQPERIFDIVGIRAGLSGFAAARIEAEQAVSDRPYTLDDIYEVLGARLGLSPQRREGLKALEIEAEVENVVPIAENLAAVSDEDLLISDMYLAPETIRTLLRKAGFDRPIPLVVSSDGKRSGRVWGEALAIFDIVEHLGDNPLTDILSAQLAGVPCRHTDVATPAKGIESVALEIGLTDLAALAREARLASWSADPQMRALQRAQTGYNLPILLIAGVLVVRLAQRLNLRRILFSSRDCVLWLPICRAIAAKAKVDLDMRYFFTSRLTRVRSSPDYLDYARASIDDRTLVVDICGTGWSPAILFQQIGLDRQALALLQRMPPRADYESLARTPETAVVHELFTGVAGCGNTAIEMCNYATHGMVVDVRRTLNCHVPIFAADARSAGTRAAVAEQHALAARFTRSIETCGLAETLLAPDALLSALGGALYNGLSGDISVLQRYHAEHQMEDQAALQQLGRGR